MITGSASFAELRQLNLVALGTARQTRGFNLGSLLNAYETAIVTTPRGFELDVVEEDAQSAWVGELELAYDRAISQAGTFGWLVYQARDPLWIAITGYYSAFFAAKALCTACGIASRALRLTIVNVTGLHRLETVSSTYTGRVTIVGTRIPPDPSLRGRARKSW